MRALSIRQPYAELILRGIKTIEYRSRRTRIIGERFYIYAARTPGDTAGFAELGCEPGDPGAPTDVKRLKRPRKPKRVPQPVWFTPF